MSIPGYSWAWADGPPFSHWRELKRRRAALQSLIAKLRDVK